jgi:hypothetical protein
MVVPRRVNTRGYAMMVQVTRRPWGEVDEGRLVSDPDVSHTRTRRLSAVPPSGGPTSPFVETADAVEALAKRRARRIALALMVLSAVSVIAVVTVAWMLLEHL